MYTKSPIKFINKCLSRIYNRLLSIVYSRQYKKMFYCLKPTFQELVTKDEEKEYIKKWSSLGYVNPIYFRLFSNYVGKDSRIAPEDIVHNIIEALLNPIEYRGPYSDKNMYDKLLNNIPNCMAKTYMRRIGGHYYDDKYNRILLNQNEIDKLNKLSGIVAKITVDTSSGLGVRLLSNRDGIMKDKTNNESLSISYLNELGSDFIVQEYLSQSEFMSSFNRSSINTLRMLVYRSVKDDEVHVLNTFLRIGRNGALMDNAHQGGAVVGVNSNGVLQHYLIDQFGNKFNEFNGIDFSTSTFTIPDWNTVMDFAKKVGESVMYHRLLNLDVMIDHNGSPKLIEFNIRSMGVWGYQYAVGACFGDYTDEIIEYCAKNKNRAISEYLLL